jgi:Tol biopolymer transport system component
VVLALCLAAAAGETLLRPSASRGDHRPAAACPQYETLRGSTDDGFGGRFYERRSAWSPNGRKIAVGGAKTVVVDVGTGRRSVVGSVRSAALGLAWSPRGGHLAAFTENEILIGVPPRPLRRVARGCFGDWSPNGRRFAFTAGGWARTANADGSQQRRVTRAAAVTDWSSRGDRLLLVRFSSREDCRTPASRALVFDFGTRSVRPLTGNRLGGRWNNERGDQVAAQFSPDGTRVAWSEGLPCRVGSVPEVEPVTFIARGTEMRGVGLGYSTWSPSSQLVALERTWSAPIVIVDSGGRLVRELGGTGAFSWSPDGAQIVLDRYDGRNEPGFIAVNLYVSSPDQPGSDRLVVSRGAGPMWSPDGSKIAFWRGTGKPRCSQELFVVSVRGGTPRKLLGC